MWVIVPKEDKENMAAPPELDKWDENDGFFEPSATRQRLRGWDRKPVLGHAPRLQGQKVWKRIPDSSGSTVEEHERAQRELLREGEGSRKKYRPIGAKENIGAARWNKACSTDIEPQLSPRSRAFNKGILTPNASKHNIHNAQSPNRSSSSPTKVGADDKLRFVPRKRTNNNHVITPKKSAVQGQIDRKTRRQSRAEIHVDNHSQSTRPRRSLRKSGQFKEVEFEERPQRASPMKVSTPRFEPKLDAHNHQSVSKPAFEVWSTLRTRQTPAKQTKSRCSASPTKMPPFSRAVDESSIETSPKNNVSIDAILGSPSAAPPTMIVETASVPGDSCPSVLAMPEKQASHASWTLCHSNDDDIEHTEHGRRLPQDPSSLPVNGDLVSICKQLPNDNDDVSGASKDMMASALRESLHNQAGNAGVDTIGDVDSAQAALEAESLTAVNFPNTTADSTLPIVRENKDSGKALGHIEDDGSAIEECLIPKQRADEALENVTDHTEATSSAMLSNSVSDGLGEAVVQDLCKPESSLGCTTKCDDDATGQMLEVEDAQERRRDAPISEATAETSDHDDTKILRNFLTRVQANKVAKNAPKRKRSLPHSPLQLPLGNLADIMSPSPQQNQGGKDELAASPSKRERKTPTTRRDEPQSIRRSARTRLPVKTLPPPNAISFLPVRRVVGDQDTTISLKRTEEKELAALTRVNTRKNKGTSLPAPVVLAKKAEEKDDPVLRQRLLKELLDERLEKGKKRTGDKARKALNVNWAEELARYQDLDTAGTAVKLAEAIDVCEDGPAVDAAAQTKARYGVKVRSKIALGMGINGTPAPKRKVKSHT